MIYFVQGNATKLIKIGFTGGNVLSAIGRRRTFQVGSPDKLTLLAVAEGDQKFEKKLHHEFKCMRSHGEWYFPCQRLLEMIERKRLSGAKQILAEMSAKGFSFRAKGDRIILKPKDLLVTTQRELLNLYRREVLYLIEPMGDYAI